MKPLLTLALIAGGLSSYLVAQTPRDASLKQLYDTHSWFELRDATHDKNLPALYLGAIASAFNRVQDARRNISTRRYAKRRTPKRAMTRAACLRCCTSAPAEQRMRAA